MAGVRHSFRNLKMSHPNQFIKIKEGVNQMEKMNLKVLDFKDG